jgi:uncharacterized protein
MSIKATLWSATMALALASIQLSAYPQEELQLPSRIGYVSDYAQILDEQVEGELNRTLSEVERELGVQIYVLTVLTTEPLPMNDYSSRIMEVWDLGEDDPARRTLLFIVAVEDGLVRLDASRGLEEMLTDQVLKQILDAEILPAFYMGEFTQGITRGIQEIIQVLSEGPYRSPSEGKGLGSTDLLGIFLMIALVALVLAAAWVIGQL